MSFPSFRLGWFPLNRGRSGSFRRCGWILWVAGWFLVPPPASTGAEAGAPWSEMDYGPFFSASIEAPAPRTNFAYKGIAVNLGRAAGTGRNEAVLFDTDLLRYAAGWTGGFVALKGVAFDGEHWAWPKTDGPQVFGNPMTPGWAATGSFADPREQPYGPLPRRHAHWKGLYVHGSDVVFEYTVGAMRVLELPGIEGTGELRAFTRTLNLGPSATEQWVQVAFETGHAGEVRPSKASDVAVEATPAVEAIALLIRRLDPSRGTEAEAERSPGTQVLAAAVTGAPIQARWNTTADGHVRLRLPPSNAPTRMKILLWRGMETRLAEFAQSLERTHPAADLEALTRGGPSRWRERLETRVRAMPPAGPFAVEELAAPERNPWRSWMRFGGVDVFPDGDRAALSTWNGDVWVVSGLMDASGRLLWQRIATGLYQPLGLKIVDDRIHVLGRDQMTVLEDRNGDGETDFYRNFNNDGMVGEHFHEFANDLKLGPDGDFYYVRCARHALPAAHAHHGTLARVSRDGSKFEIVARGFRAVNGLGVGPAGELTTVDNQGHWMPANRLNWVVPGGWYGNQWAWNPERRTDYDRPLCWVHNFVDRSGGTHLWVPREGWGALGGELMTISYGMGHLFVVLKEEVDGVMQGAVTRLPPVFETGVMRGVFHPQTRDLLICGLYGWAGNKTRAGGFFRIRPPTGPLGVPLRLNVAKNGLVLGFPEALDPSTATDPGRYDLKAWNYRWSANYGSPDLRSDGTQGRDTWRVESATLSADRRTVFLAVPEIRPVMQYHLVFDLRSADGAPVQNFVHGTIHRVGSQDGLATLGAGVFARAAGEEDDVRLRIESPGLVRSFARPDGTWEDARPVRLAALHVAAGRAATPWLEAGPFRARWQGYLKVDLSEDVVFSVEGRGRARLRVNGTIILDVAGPELGGTDAAARRSPLAARVAPDRIAPAVALRRGLNRFELEYESPQKGDAELRVGWSSRRRGVEPIPATAFVHDDADQALKPAATRDAGRTLFAERQCIRCHTTSDLAGPGTMPELGMDAPVLDGVGSRLRSEWLVRWLRDPRGMRPDARMPRVLEGPDAEADARDLAAALMALRDAAASGVAPDRSRVEAGAQRFADLGCAGCHALPGEPELTGDRRISLAGVAAKWRPEALPAFLRQPSARHAWTRMPNFQLDDAEAGALASFLLERTREREPAPEASPPGDARRGRELLASRGCLNCHAIEGGRPTLEAPSLAEVMAGRGAERGCLGDAKQARGRAPDWAWTALERERLTAFLGDISATDALRRDSVEGFATRQYEALRCGACHARDDEPDVLSIVESIALGGSTRDEEEEGTSGTVHGGRPGLSYAGEKLYAGWMERLLAGTLSSRTRPGLAARMPAFPMYARGLAAGLSAQHGHGFESAPRLAVEASRAETGRGLTRVEGGFGCVTCHDVGDQRALAGKDTATVNFNAIGERLRPEYYWRYLQDPSRAVPATMMPKFIGDDGTTPIKEVMDGDPLRQFDAVWHYLHSLRPGQD